MGKDPNSYNANPEIVEEILNDIHANYPDTVLGPEQTYLFEHDLLRFTIRLARYKFVARILQKTDRVLEVGCGSGMGAIFMGQHAASVKGIDIRPSEIESATGLNRRDNVSFELQDVFEFEGDDQYDVVVSLDVIEHMDEEQGREFVERLARRVKPDGMLVIGSPSHWSFPHQSKISQAGHIKCYKQEELVALLGEYFDRTIPFSMNDEVVHTGHPKMAWYYFVLGLVPNERAGA